MRDDAERIEEFRQMVTSHDVSFDFSDDGSVWRRGAAEYKRIREFAAQYLTPETASAVWNEIVDPQFLPEPGKEHNIYHTSPEKWSNG